MRAFELHMPDGKPAAVWCCGECKVLFSEKHRYSRGDTAQGAAEECCGKYQCDRCGCETARFQMRCQSCREAAAFDKAEKVKAADWNGWVVTADDENRYFASVDELLDHYDGAAETPEYCWACEFSPVLVECGDLLEPACEPHHEDIDLQLNGAVELAAAVGAAIKTFNEANAKVGSYFRVHPPKAVLLGGEQA